jgi:hypothetical protein
LTFGGFGVLGGLGAFGGLGGSISRGGNAGFGITTGAMTGSAITTGSGTLAGFGGSTLVFFAAGAAHSEQSTPSACLPHRMQISATEKTLSLGFPYSLYRKRRRNLCIVRSKTFMFNKKASQNWQGKMNI